MAKRDTAIPLQDNPHMRQEIDYGRLGIVAHEEALGLLLDGRVVFWDDARKVAFMDGTTLETLDRNSLGVLEWDRIESQANMLKLELPEVEAGPQLSF